MSKTDLVWSKTDTEFLACNYNLLTASELQSRFPSKSINAIRKKARKMGIHVSKDMEFANRSAVRTGDLGSNWHGGRRHTSNGYIQVLCKEHPRADSSGYVMEHILVWERETGIPVPRDFVVHHLDGNKENNDISNLCLMTFEAHTTYHNKLRKKVRNC